MSKISGGELAVRALRRAGVDAAFVLHGAHVDGIFQACRSQGVRVVDVRHEASAGFAAEAYARSRRGLGVAVVTAGPGFTNVITSIANALEDKTPVLYLVGSARLAEAETNALQAGIDQVAVARPITKWAHRITQPQQIPRLVAQAIRVATSHPQGPVLIDIPFDVLDVQIDEAELGMDAPVMLDQQLSPNQADLERAAELLATARRPVVMVGPGAYQTHAEGALLEFVERTGIPVFIDPFAHGTFPSDHALYAATFFKMAELSGADERPDVVLAVGVRFGLNTASTSDVVVPLQAQIIHIDTDPKEIGRVRPAVVGLVADCREALLRLADLLPPGPIGAEDWAGHVAAAMDRRRESSRAAGATAGARMHPAKAAEAVLAALPRNAILVADGAEVNAWQDEFLCQTLPGSFLGHGHLGCMGGGLGMAIGAKVASPDRPVVCTTGDGSVGFAFAEFETMARQGLGVTVVVMNNRHWGSSTHYQLRHGGEPAVVGTRLGAARYDEAAAAMGCLAFHVTDPSEIGPAMEQALASGRAACINIEVAFPEGGPPNMAAFGRR